MGQSLNGKAEYDQKVICPPECPDRKVGCHNAETCKRWAEHEKRQKKCYAKRRAEYYGSVDHRAPKK